LHPGAEDYVGFCERHHKHVPPWAHPLVQWVLWISHPVQKHLASAVGALIVASITWTALLLKKRWFNAYIADSTVADNGAEGPEVRV
jgi:hypothetical protein